MWFRLSDIVLEQGKQTVLTGEDGSVGGGFDPFGQPGDPENIAEPDAGESGDGRNVKKISRQEMFDVLDLGKRRDRVHLGLHSK